MSQSSLEAGNQSADYVFGWQALYELARRGRSFSGQERHCGFLNLGGKGFADVSSATGLHLDDDGRAVAVTDWDQDGRLDLWISNRTGPRVRFLRNDVAKEGHFLALRLQGTTSNRDAIGARVELRLGGAQPATRIKTLHAGDGYLAQSSKWVHFGLGTEPTTIEGVRVLWPGGDAEDFSGLSVDGRYRLVQGSGSAVEVPRRAPVQLTESTPQAPEPSGRARIPLASRLNMPDVPFLTHDDQPAELGRFSGRPVLVNLWASWCANCVVELRAFTEREADFQNAGVPILALTVDELEDREKAFEMLSSMGWPFGVGSATEETLTVLDLLQETVLDQHGEMVVPTSFLLDRRHRLAVLYHGPVEPERVLQDIRELPAAPDVVRDRAAHSEGRWLGGLHLPEWLTLAGKLEDHGRVEEAGRYLVRLNLRLSEGQKSSDKARQMHAMLLRLARKLGGERPELAQALTQRAGELLSDDVNAIVAQAAAARERGDLEQAIVHYERALVAEPTNVRAHYELGLARLLREEFDAAESAFRAALALDDSLVNAHMNVGILLIQKERHEEALPFLERAVELAPGNQAARGNLDALRRVLGR